MTIHEFIDLFEAEIDVVILGLSETSLDKLTPQSRLLWILNTPELQTLVNSQKVDYE